MTAVEPHGVAMETVSAGNKSRARIAWGIDRFLFEATVPASCAAEALGLFGEWQPDPAATELAGEWEILEAAAGAWEIRCGEKPAWCRESPQSALAGVESLAIQRIAEETGPEVGLHAALIASPHGFVGLVGRCTSGKSTLGCAMAAHRGWRMLGDDSLLVRLDANGVPTAFSGPRRIAVRTASRELLGEEFWRGMMATRSRMPTEDGYLFSAEELWGASETRAGRLSALFLLDRRDSGLGVGEVRALSSGEAALALAPYTYARERAGFGAALLSVAPLCGAVRVFELQRGALDGMISTISSCLS